MPENHEHLGDGVYAEFTGYSFNIRADDHRNPVVVVFEPEVLAAFVRFADRMLGTTKLETTTATEQEQTYDQPTQAF